MSAYNVTRPLSLVLEPGLFEDDAGQVWRNLADGADPSIADVVTTLARTYARNGYMRFRQGGGQPGLRAGGEHMGRRVEAQDHPAAPGDRAIVPPAPADMAPGASSPSPARVSGSPGSTQAQEQIRVVP
ncbi:hypothetical protein Daus18300_005579 [Diaporthe australafricana]|uniref:Uncharacterized protein n=1 Tax=Diaporthe australafricana TaxID=127596 RepID=A0ABR3X0Z8_9PEZI